MNLDIPLRPFEIQDEMMDSYLEMVIEDYSSLLNGWLIQQQWIGLEGLDRENSDFVSAFTTKSGSYMKSFTYAYSNKSVLQQMLLLQQDGSLNEILLSPKKIPSITKFLQVVK